MSHKLQATLHDLLLQLQELAKKHNLTWKEEHEAL